MLLLLREEIICAIVLIFLIFYYSLNKIKDRENFFLKLACAALLHVIFDIVTVITVNSLDTVPELLNRALHICFYISGILFIQCFYNYVIHLTMRYKYMRILKRIAYIPLLLFIVLLLFLPMEYVEGSGTNYSFGPLIFVGYGIFTVYCVVCMTMLLAARKKLDRKVRHALIPMILAMFTAILLQALIPELLMTGAGVTFVCIGMFVALDNPDKDFKKQALWDFLTGLKNRNCYNRDLEKYIHRFNHKNADKRIGFIVADMNYLKTVNDNYGHAEGDRLITAAAETLQSNLKSAQDVYRLGGDEFVAIYLSPDDAAVQAEIENVQAACSKATGFMVPLSIAIGYASGVIDEHTADIFKSADQRMYEHKASMRVSR